MSYGYSTELMLADQVRSCRERGWNITQSHIVGLIRVAYPDEIRTELGLPQTSGVNCRSLPEALSFIDGFSAARALYRHAAKAAKKEGGE